MSITVVAFFTQSSGSPATGLTLTDINLYLTAIAKSDGAQTVIWDGTQNPTAEVASLGLYFKSYASPNLTLYDYAGGAHYTGATALDSNWTMGVISAVETTGLAGAGSETVTIECLDATSVPLEGVAVWVTSDSGGATVRAGTLYSNSSGLVTVYLDPGSYFVWRQGGANWSNPQPITVTDV